MFIRLTSSEMVTIFRSLAILLVIVVLGVTTTEKQLNSLTQRQNCVQAFNLKREKTGVYSTYLLGYGYSFNAVYPIAKIDWAGNNLFIETAGQKIAVPTYIYLDSSKLVNWLNIWYKQFVDEAFKTKQSLELYCNIAHKKVDAFNGKIRHLLENPDSGKP